MHPVPEPSVDRIIVGDGDTIVAGIGVVWMPTWSALRAAAQRGLNVVVAHEPTFFTHHDLDGFDGAFAELPPRARETIEATRTAKLQWLETHRMVVIRCHDVLDAMPGGVVDQLAHGLGFSPDACVTKWERYRVCALPAPDRAGQLAAQLAARFASLGQPGVGFYGDADRVVRTLGLGTGYGCEVWRFLELGAEMAITIDDRIKTWTEGEWADDAGYPLVVINHGTSEEWGVRALAARMQREFSHLPVGLLPGGCSHRWIGPADRSSDDKQARPRGEAD